MQVSNPNNVKIYNLSAGKSLPEWLSDRRKRTLQKQDGDIRRRIELIQDFEMPTVSHCVQASPDGQFIYVAGTYKPRLRCYDVHQLSMKFERGLDTDVIRFQFLSEDYSKIVFLQCDRYLEFHTQFGRYYRTRIPKYGRDLAFHNSSCDLYLVGVSPEVFRLNLEQGRFLNPLVTNAQEVNCCEFNPVHNLFACGTSEGHVECFDPRVRHRVGLLDTALSSHIEDLDITGIPAITAMKFRGALQLGVGTSTGHVLLYDMRSDKPLLVKDHQYELPIKQISFQDNMDLVLSMDSKILKLWNRNTGKAYTAIEPGTNLNNMAVLPGSGLIFMANEAPKVLTYYIPSLGTAPRWCSFLDNLTEELEETSQPTVYDDYKFITRKELDDMGLSHLIGSNLLRAYMHGFFIDIRLYHKAKAIADPFAYEEYRKNKIREKIEEERSNRVRLKKLPKVNRDLAEKLITRTEDQTKKSKVKKAAATLLGDDRFAAMFENPDFQIDTQSHEYKMLNPVVSHMDKSQQKKARKEQFQQVQEGMSGDEKDESDNESSSDDEHTWTEEVKRKHRQAMREERMQRRAERLEEAVKPKFYELKDGQEYGKDNSSQRKQMKKSLAERLEAQQDAAVSGGAGTVGNKEMMFTMKKNSKEKRRESKSLEHHIERRQIRRSATDITKGFRDKNRYWMNKNAR